MEYLTFQPQADLDSLVKCYWTLEIPNGNHFERQRIIPDGCIEMIAIRFYPYGIANFVTLPIENLANKETPIEQLFGEKTAKELEHKIIQSTNTQERIQIIEAFLLEKFSEKSTVDTIVKTTIDAIMSANGTISINSILEEDLTKRRQLERKFLKQIGISPKKLGKIIRLQTALKMILKRQSTNLTQIAYESEYFDQAHFIKDFKEFTGINPKKFLNNEKMTVSSLFYSEK